MELSDGGSLPNLVRNCRWTIVTDWHSWTVTPSHLPFAAILVNCAPSGEMHNYCTPHIIKENYENFLIHRCNYILLSQVYCVLQVVKTPTIISNSHVNDCILELSHTASRLTFVHYLSIKPSNRNRVNLSIFCGPVNILRTRGWIQ